MSGQQRLQEMRSRFGRSRTAVAAVVVASALLFAGCGSSSGSADRNAASYTNQSDYSTEWQNWLNYQKTMDLDLNEFCAPPRDDAGASGFTYVRNIVTCFVLVNKAERFSAPNTLGGKVPLTVNKAACGVAQYPCQNMTGYYGEIRNQGQGSVYGFRTLVPDPFTDVGAMQFQPAKIWQGTTNRLWVESNFSPFNLEQTAAQPEFSNPSSGSNSGNCDTQGSFIGCSLDAGSWQADGKEMRPRYTFFTKPMRITINNNTGMPMTLSASPLTGRGFLLDPVAISQNIESIPTGSRAFVGGYRSTNSPDEQSWSASYCINYKPTGSMADAICVPVDITIKVALVDGKWVNQSQCNPQSRSAAVTYKCDVPTMNDSDSDRIVTINIKNF
ncbi:hypothetical protein MCETE4_01966 [Acidimicrobiia bacterium]